MNWIEDKTFASRKKYEEAQGLCELILQQYPDSPQADDARVYLSKRNILSLIDSKNYTEAQEVLDNLVADFADRPDMPEALHTIAGRYELPGKYQEAESLYEQIVELYPDSPYAAKARFDGPEIHIFFLIASKKYTEAQEAIEKLTADFPDYPGLPGSLYWFAKRLEAEAAAQYQQARNIYQKVAWQYPDDPHATKALIGVYKVDALSSIQAGDDTAAEATINNLVADFGDNVDLPATVFALGDQYYHHALALENEGLEDESRERFQKAMAVWDRIITDSPPSAPDTLHAHYYSALCLCHLAQFESATNMFKHVIQEWPGASLAAPAYYSWALCCCRLGQYEEAKSIFQQTIDRHPSSFQAEKARVNITRIGELSLSREESAQAISFFESQHRNWFAVKNGVAGYRTIVRRSESGTLIEDPRSSESGTIQFTVTSADNPNKSQGPQIKVHLSNGKWNFSKDNVLDLKASWRQWSDDPNSPIAKSAGRLRKRMELLFYPFNFMARTYPAKQWNTRQMMPKWRFFATRGLPMARSTQQETDTMFAGEPQYLFLPSYSVTAVQYWFSTVNGQLRQIDMFAPDNSVTSFRYENYVQKDDCMEFPQRLTLVNKKQKSDTTKRWEFIVELTDLNINVDGPQ